MTSPASVQHPEDGSAAASDTSVRRSYERLCMVGPDRAALESPELTGEVSRHWADAVNEARAAAARYAQLALDLLRLGASSQCVQACANAMHRELSHARRCVELGRAFGGHDVRASGSTAQPPSHRDPASLAVAVLRQGCVYETVQAFLAREALEHCRDAATREALVELHEAKAQQAQLSFSVLGWLLRHGDEALAEAVRSAALSTLHVDTATRRLEPVDRRLSRFGLLSENHRAALEHRVLRDVVLPCIQSLLARRSSPPPPPPRAAS